MSKPFFKIHTYDYLYEKLGHAELLWIDMVKWVSTNGIAVIAGEQKYCVDNDSIFLYNEVIEFPKEEDYMAFLIKFGYGARKRIS